MHFARIPQKDPQNHHKIEKIFELISDALPFKWICCQMIVFFLPPYTLAGFDLTTHNSADRDDTTRPRRSWAMSNNSFPS
jgi:hypothetical protein